MSEAGSTERVLLVGDVHGDLPWWTKFVVPAALEHDCDTIIQLGDFGYWEHTKSGVHYLAGLSRALCKGPRPLDLYWIDGNHENHDWLAMYVGEGAARLQPAPIRERITYLPRGCVLTLGDTKFMAAGGAYSIDKDDRIPGQSWWPQEVLTELDVRTCRVAGKVDVVLSHDAPFRYPIGTEILHSARKMDSPETRVNRDRLTRIVLAARPKLVVHGHWHVFMDSAHPLRDPTDDTDPGDVPPMVRIVGLDCQRRAFNMAVLELPSLRVATLGLHEGVRAEGRRQLVKHAGALEILAQHDRGSTV